MRNMRDMDVTEMTYGERLAIRRRLAGFTQQEIAERIPVDRVTVARWETGKNRLDPLRYRSICHLIDTMHRDRTHQLAALDPDGAA